MEHLGDHGGGGTQLPLRQVNSYSALSKAFHWLGAFLLIAILSAALGFAFTPPAERASAIPTHASVAMVLVLLTLVRLSYRQQARRKAPPPLVAGRPAALGRWSHRLLYGLILLQGLLGVWLAAVSPMDIRLFSGLNLSALAPVNMSLGDTLRNLHFAVAVTLAALVLAHILAAFWHLLACRDGVFSRMFPFSGLWQRLQAEAEPPLWRFPSQVLRNWPKEPYP